MIYLKYLRMNLFIRLQYPFTMYMHTFAQFITAFGAFFGIYLLFDRFGGIAGWTFNEVALCFGVTETAFAIAEIVSRGFDILPRLVKSGDFDRILLRPRGAAVQLICHELAIQRIGRMIQGLAVLGWAISKTSGWTAAKVAALITMNISGVFVFTGLFMIGAFLSFFTVEGLEFMNIFTHGGREIAMYPLTIYARRVMQFFTFIIPFGSFNYLPLLYVTGRAEGTVWHLLSPLLGIVFILPCLAVFRTGVRRYLSTGN